VIVKLIYGTETGFTHQIGEDIIRHLNPEIHHLIKVDETEETDWKADLLILGAPTWFDGEMSDDWNDFYNSFKEIDFTGQTVAIYGLGDQVGYGKNFVDGLGLLARPVLEAGGRVIGYTSTDGFNFEESNGLVNDNTFYGMAIDEDNEPTKSPWRIMDWVKQLKEEL
tara:strand:- start:430 stop:930 length:501 start_codon:yes stop_codon:yes gene_type:complete